MLSFRFWKLNETELSSEQIQQNQKFQIRNLSYGRKNRFLEKILIFLFFFLFSMKGPSRRVDKQSWLQDEIL